MTAVRPSSFTPAGLPHRRIILVPIKGEGSALLQIPQEALLIDFQLMHSLHNGWYWRFVVDVTAQPLPNPEPPIGWDFRDLLCDPV